MHWVLFITSAIVIVVNIPPGSTDISNGGGGGGETQRGKGEFKLEFGPPNFTTHQTNRAHHHPPPHHPPPHLS